ncbi:MAG TPA: MotA/TolQ/ExbB proton channel family protein [Ottowia sp.]|nr:MotA/TolQ/ExbB proton channel family protein [Ottowia sp.]HOK11698.1 MotA/TolQ/ExbB proton channel family protein [Ottowia sp.]HOM20641.1 MotA/TolQ/ExbB proton channel family protein [Ottowia sp.]HON29582.1 MotA/TolQ/ExbB proton channel family protein [Ottowia sp.]HPP97666.1 MotA/TolQ/ExbB proton channel family protein [Ottowia sp.]
MNNEFGLLHVWAQGDWVTRGVFGALLLMSLASWVVIVLKALGLMRTKGQAARVEGFWHSSDIAEGLAKLGAGEANPFRELAIEGREAAAHHRATQAQLHDSLDVSDWISRALQGSIDATTSRLQAGLAVLASVGSTAPFVGLFGTVWGIYHALMKIGAAGQASIDQVAGPIGEALIMTALGLAVAIPAVLGYNALVRGNKNLLVRLGRFAHDLHAYYVTGSRVHGAGDGKVVAMKKA